MAPLQTALCALAIAAAAGFSAPAPREARSAVTSGERPARVVAPPPGEGYADSGAIRGALLRSFGADSGMSITYRPVILDSASRAGIAKAARSPFADDTLRIYVCRKGNVTVGYGLLDNVRGKSREITYLLALRPGGEVASVEVLVYRESHGAEIASPAFRNQFTGKKPGDPLLPGRDIQTISGATISSRSVTAGVARLLAAFERVRGRL